jgi:hypothetical protein
MAEESREETDELDDPNGGESDDGESDGGESDGGESDDDELEDAPSWAVAVAAALERRRRKSSSATATRYCPDCTGRYADSPLGAPRRRLRHLGRALAEPIGVERVAWVFPDAVAYLANERLRSDIHDLLAYRLPPKGTPVILVAHSLGTVVASDLWAEFGDRYRTRLFLTAGSPLGVPLVQRRLHPRTAAWTRELPADFPWVNVLDPVDPVTLARELRSPAFDPSIVNLEVENGRRFHSEDRYLSHIAVAREVLQAAR